MLIAIEGRDSPVCETVSRSRPDSGVAYLPAVSVRFTLDPRELRLQYEAGRLRYDLRRTEKNAFLPGPVDAVRLYHEAGRSAAEPEKPDGQPFNEIA